MKQPNDLPCCAVRDLLPNDLEQLTSPETHGLIEEHLKMCASCRAVRDRMCEVPGAEPCPADDAAAAGFLKRTRRRARQKALLAALFTLALCAIAFFALVVQQHPFAFTAENVCRLPDGSLYFELCTSGRESGVAGVSYSDGLDADGDYEIRMGYSLYALLGSDADESDTKRYAFVLPADIVSELEPDGSVCCRSSGGELVIWDGVSPLPEASIDVQQRAQTVLSPFTVLPS